MLVRKISREIEHWIDNSQKALIIYGARQVGKTYIVRSVLEARGEGYVEFNLIRDKSALEVLHGFTSVDDLILKLSLLSEKPLTPYKTFIFFDEIQEYPEIVTTIKFLVEDGRFRYILSGSLLGVEIKNIKSAPVGYLQSLTMYPLDFEEFLQLFRVDKKIMDGLKDCYTKRQPVDEVIHKRFNEIFNLYLIIGGMPAAVDAYQRTNNIDDVITEHNSIIEQYKQDFTKYEAQHKRLFLTRIYDIIPAELNEKNKRFNVSDVEKGARYDRIKDDFIWLTAAGVAIATYNVTEPVLPFSLNEKASLFKLFLSDVGLLTTMYGKATKLKIVNGAAGINKGGIFENVVAQELTAHGYASYYYVSKKFGELDFVLEHDGHVLPIEVKSGKDYTRHSALDNVLNVEEYGISEALVFSSANISVDGKVVYYPVYMAMFLSEEIEADPVLPLSRFSF